MTTYFDVASPVAKVKGGVQVTVPRALMLNIKKKAVEKAKRDMVDVLVSVAYDLAHDYMMETDHTLKELSLSPYTHPYSKWNPRSGSIPHQPSWIIHRQSGALMGEFVGTSPDNIKPFAIYTSGGGGGTAYWHSLDVWLELDQTHDQIYPGVPKAQLLHEGTKHMVGRPFLNNGTVKQMIRERMLLSGMTGAAVKGYK